jgi:hypothetical protein
MPSLRLCQIAVGSLKELLQVFAFCCTMSQGPSADSPAGQASWMTPPASNGGDATDGVNMWKQFMHDDDAHCSKRTDNASLTVGMALNLQKAVAGSVESAHRAAARAEAAASGAHSAKSTDKSQAKKAHSKVGASKGGAKCLKRPSSDEALPEHCQQGPTMTRQRRGQPCGSKTTPVTQATLPAGPTLPEAQPLKMDNGEAKDSQVSKATMAKRPAAAVAKPPAAAAAAAADAFTAVATEAAAAAIVVLKEPPRQAHIKSFGGAAPPKDDKLLRAWEATVDVWAWHFGANCKDSMDVALIMHPVVTLQFPFGGRVEGQRMMWTAVKAGDDPTWIKETMAASDGIRKRAVSFAKSWCRDMLPRLEQQAIMMHNQQDLID